MRNKHYQYQSIKSIKSDRGTKGDLYYIGDLYQIVALTNQAPTNLTPYTKLSSIPISATGGETGQYLALSQPTDLHHESDRPDRSPREGSFSSPFIQTSTQSIK